MRFGLLQMLSLEPQSAKSDVLHLEGLDNAQRAAVLKPAVVPVMILAPPGSGKTTTLCYRIGKLICSDGVRPARILAVTFSNKACRDMKLKLSKLALEAGMSSIAEVPVRTFHGWALGVLQQFNALPPDVSIWDARLSLCACKLALAQYAADTGDNTLITARQVAKNAKYYLTLMTRLRMRLVGTEQLLADTPMREVWTRYVAVKQACNAIDFDDMLEFVIKAAYAHNGLKTFLLEAYDCLVVDEVRLHVFWHSSVLVCSFRTPTNSS